MMVERSMQSRPRNRGFTLLEVMVATAILGMGLTAILSAQAGAFATAAHARNVSVATTLARCKMGEIEEHLYIDGVQELEEIESGVCCEGDETPNMKCSWKIEKPQFPEPKLGELNLDTNRVTANGGLQEREASAMGLKPNLLPETELTDAAIRAQTAAATGVDLMTSLHMRTWLECVRSGKTPNAPVEAGYSHSVSTIMTTAALHTGRAVTFDPRTQEVLAGGEVFEF